MSRLSKSFVHAARGLGYTFAHEGNFRVHTAAALVVLILGAWVRVSAREWATLILVMVLVMALELVNTAVEKILDSVHPRLRATVGLAKDILAGAVLLAAAAAVLVGGLIFIPYFLEP